MTPRIEYKLYGRQYELFTDWCNTDKNCINIVHAGAGKTFLAQNFLPIAATHHHLNKGKDVIYVAPTHEMIKTLIWEGLKNTCRDIYGLEDGVHINNSDKTIRFPNGIFIRCKSAESPLRGMNAGIIIADEASLFTQDALQELTVRLRPKVGEPETVGRLIVISTPVGRGPLYDLFQAAQANPDRWIARHYGYREMQSGNLAFIEEQRQLLSPLKFAQDYECSWEQVQDQFYYTWNKSYCENIQDTGTDLYSFHDWNKRVMCAIIARADRIDHPQGRIHIVKSYALKNASTEDIARRIREDFPRRRIFSIIDMSGTQTNRDTTSPFGVTDRTIIERYGFQVINTRHSNPLIADTDNSANAFIAQGRLRVNPEDTLLLEALSTYHYEDATRKRLVKYDDANYAHIDGLGDALRYGIHHLFPVRHAMPEHQNYVTDDARFYRRPGREYLPESPLFDGGPTIEEIVSGSADTNSPDYVTWE